MNTKSQDMFRSSFESMYLSDNRSLRRGNFTKSASLSTESEHDSALVFDGVSKNGFSLAGVDAAEYVVQRPIREWFGKDGVNSGKIGTHPDFEFLYDSDETRNHYISTVFVDIRNSTRLSLRYDLLLVRKIKNTILRAASETVRALDGHVHRFMGDALMAYFGGMTQDRESACMAAINCAAMLRVLMEEVIVPGLNKQRIDPTDLGFRIGIDYGDDCDVLWSSYGYADVSEITATSFFVDSAAKLQSMASKDSAMLGNSLVRHLDFPDVFTRKKTEQRSGEPVPVLYLRPNYALQDGTSHNYEIHELKFKEFARLLPIPLDMRQDFLDGLMACPGICFQAFLKKANSFDEYRSLSACVDKGVEVRFQVCIQAHALNGLRLPLRGKWVRRNYGQQAEDAGMSKDECGEFNVVPNGANRGSDERVYSWTRHAEYRGIHSMSVSILDNRGELVFSDVIGIHIR